MAQKYKYTSELDPVDATGFYIIDISPQVSALTRNDFADIRIADKNKQWVPHILQSGKAALAADLFTAFPILQNTLTDSGKNLLVIENTKAEGIDNLKLFLKNAAVNRTAVLSGSNNQRDWYIIDDHIAISRSYETMKDEYLQEINFPLSKYRYLKIIINNVQNDPLLITKAGFYARPSLKQLIIYQDNPIPQFTQKDSSRYTYILVKQDSPYQFDKISINLSGPKYYNREVEICLPDFGNHQRARPGSVIGNFKIIPALPAVFELPRVKTAQFFIVIKNADNPPLIIEKVITQLQTVSLVTYLESGKKYDLLLGDSLGSFADYDLQSFKDSIGLPRQLNFGKVNPINSIIDETTRNQNRWIWPAIIFAGITLSFLVYRMTGEINKSKNITPDDHLQHNN